MKLTSRQWRKIELIPGWLDYKNAQLMYSISINSNLSAKGNILDIGAYYGKTSALLTYSLKDLETITCVDSFGMSPLTVGSEFTAENQNFYYESLTLKKFNRFYKWATQKNPNVLIGLSSQVLPTVKGGFRLIHIDGGHTYEDVKFDTTHSIRLLNPDGLIVFDDYSNDTWPGVKKAIDEFLEQGTLVPIINLDKLYCTLPAYSDLFVNKLLRELQRFEVIKQNQNSKLEPQLKICIVYKQPKIYPYLYRRLLTAILARI